jgi:hypothetical protein
MESLDYMSRDWKDRTENRENLLLSSLWKSQFVAFLPMQLSLRIDSPVLTFIWKPIRSWPDMLYSEGSVFSHVFRLRELVTT